ncbi:MAG: agmatine deiminase, partial [Candidatus Binatia bacterium]
RFEVVEIPSPGSVCTKDGTLMPASHLNFVLSNGVMIVPLYDTDRDALAVDAFAAACPQYRVVGASARGILSGGGAFHCITQQEPGVTNTDADADADADAEIENGGSRG